MSSPANFVIAFSHEARSGNYCQSHCHGGVEIVFHPSGSGLTSCADGSALAFGPGETILYPPGLQHDQRMDVTGIDNCVQIGVRDAAAFPEFKRPLKLPFLRSQTALAELSELSAWNDDSPRQAKDLRAAALLLTLLDEAARHELGKPEPGLALASEARALAVSELRRPLDAKRIARAVGLSPDHLRHLVRRHFGKGLKELSLEARLSRAMNLLANSPMTLKELADECGFANERAFCAAFKKRLGSSPGAYRRTHWESPA